MEMAQRDYEGEGITVHWDSERCIHSQLCVMGAPSVFDHDARPWVNVEGASADEVARVVDRCPSGALSYTRTDGLPNGRRGYGVEADAASATRSDDAAPEAVQPVMIALGDEVPTITPLPDGPLLVQGRFGIARDDGTIEIVERVTLCRCGHSGTKPHCDGSHARVGFEAPGVLPAEDGGQRVVIRAGGLAPH
jgi:uncharacterized Fe-S cluster protein YjdI/CDGSH-type Zn-finger protein